MKLRIHVLILQHGRREPLDHWWEDSNTWLLEEKWAKSSGLWPRSLLNDEPDPMAVALCLDKESLLEGYELQFIRRVVEQAHKSMWGANVYLVMDVEAALLSTASETAGEREIPLWLESIFEHRIADVLRWSIKIDANFGRALRRSADRMQKITVSGLHRPWKCMVQSPPELSREQQSLLSHFLIDSFNQLQEQSCLMVIPEERQDERLEWLKRKLQSVPTGTEIMIGFVDRITDPPPELEAFCDSNQYPLIRFHGMIELYSFLHKLNPVNFQELESHTVPVRTEQRPAFKSVMPPLLLLTHSYQIGEERSSLLAAYDSWELTKDLSDGLVKIYPAISCVKLAEILEEMDHLLAWIHIGHGDEAQRLVQAGNKQYQTADDWLGCFAAYQSSLALAVFSSCNSAAVAKRFAESGARVAIGFTKRVHKDVCIELTKRVVKAALETNGAREAILQAFTVGRNVLNTDDKEAMPVAFWAS